METQEVEAKRKPGRPKAKKWEAATAKGKRTGDRRAHDDSIHASRVQDEREAEDVHELADEPWVNPVSLPYIKPRAGMVQRWIRVAIRGEVDPVNVARKLREGWAPRKIETVPKSIPVPRIESGKYAGCIGVEGSILMEMTVERNDARNKYFAGKNQRQSDAVQQRLNEETHGMAKNESTTKRVREVAVAADE